MPAAVLSGEALGKLLTYIPPPSSIIWYGPMGGDARRFPTDLVESSGSLPPGMSMRLSFYISLCGETGMRLYVSHML